METTHNMIVKSSRCLCGGGVLAILLSASVAQAAVSITGNYIGATAPVLDNSFGTLESALNIGGAGLTRDGIVFVSAGTTDVGTVRTFLSNGGLSSTIDVLGTVDATGPNGNPGSWATATLGGGDPLFSSIGYGANSVGMTVDVTDLDPTQTYQLQFLFADARNGDFPYTRSITVSDSSSSTATAPISFGKNGLGDEFSVVTAVVSGSNSFKFLLPNTGDGVGAPLISGLVIHSVPEPSAALLGGLGLLGLLTRRRRA